MPQDHPRYFVITRWGTLSNQLSLNESRIAYSKRESSVQVNTNEIECNGENLSFSTWQWKRLLQGKRAKNVNLLYRTMLILTANDVENLQLKNQSV